MKIIWNQVTRTSQVVALCLFIIVFFLGIFIGKKVAVETMLGPVTHDVVFLCDEEKSIHVLFYGRAVQVQLPQSPKMFLVQTISASGARYANVDESVVFWNKGDEALIMRDNQMDLNFKNCKVQLW
jgi:membrane-bound inhibitor of C-type lysozyme